MNRDMITARIYILSIKKHATLVAMATVHEKFQTTFPMKVLSQFEENFIFSMYVVILQD